MNNLIVSDLRSPKRPLLVLDLDETLVHSTYNPTYGPPDLHVFEFYIYYRPFLQYFLRAISKSFDIGIWSAGTQNYVEEVVSKIMPKDVNPIFVYGRWKCDERDFNGFIIHVKPLKELEVFGYNIDKMIIVDDSPEKCIDNFENAIIPRKFVGQDFDMELFDLLIYLDSIKYVNNFREINHKNWKY
jgi:carboxy-terminal domain RNA polymerase II polypeptide A small phosphatase